MSLSDDLPLRTTADWGRFESVQTIPVGFGRVCSVGIAYNQRRTEFVFLDGVNGAVESVTVNDEPFDAWEADQVFDNTDKPMTLVRTNEPIDGVIKICGNGMLGTSSGKALVNPADVIGHALTLSGFTHDLAEFRTECAKRGLEIAGLFAGGKTGRAQVQEIAESIGVIWSAASDRFAAFHPGTLSSSLAAVDKLGEFQAKYDRGRIYNVARIKFDFDHSAGDYRQVVQMEVKSSIAVYGRIVHEIEAPWLFRTSDAERLCTRLLQHYSRALWTMTCATDADVDLGDAIDNQHARSAITGDQACIRIDKAPLKTGKRVILEAPAGASPDVTFVGSASVFDPVATNKNVQFVDDRVLIPVTDTGGRPIQGAEIKLIDPPGPTVETDGSGIAEFPASQIVVGRLHTFQISAPNRPIMTFKLQL